MPLFANERLLSAASECRMKSVKAMLAKGTAVNMKKKYGETAVMLAAKNGHTDIMQLLKKAVAKSRPSRRSIHKGG